MEFWGVEVPSGKPLTCKPGETSYVHVSQAALGENKTAKGSDRVVLKVKVGDTEVVVGTLSQGKCDQTTLDLIFEKDFVLSHNSSGSVYFCGYKTDAVRDDMSGSSDEEDDEFDVSDEDEEAAPELVEPAAKENGKLVLKAGKAVVPVIKPPAKSPASKVEASVVEVKSKAKPGVVEKGKGGVEKSKVEDDDDDDEDADDDEEDDDEDDDMLGSGSEDEDLDSDEEDDSDDSDESEEDQPKSAGKKRPAPVLQGASAGKKNKIATPGKPEPKTPSVPTSTPKQHQQSSKKDLSAKKTPGKENKSLPASGTKLGQHFCQPCNKNFTSESALTQHKSAKHK